METISHGMTTTNNNKLIIIAHFTGLPTWFFFFYHKHTPKLTIESIMRSPKVKWFQKIKNLGKDKVCLFCLYYGTEGVFLLYDTAVAEISYNIIQSQCNTWLSYFLFSIFHNVFFAFLFYFRMRLSCVSYIVSLVLQVWIKVFLS